MSLRLSQLNRFMLFVLAPIIGLVLAYSIHGVDLQISVDKPALDPPLGLESQTDQVIEKLRQSQQTAALISDSLAQTRENYERISGTAGELLARGRTLSDRPLQIYDTRVTRLLGTPIKTIQSDNIDLKVYPLNEKTYNGYAMKVHLKSDSAMKLVLSGDELGKSESTLSAAKRYKAVAGVNAGGFADDRHGKRYPLSTTMMNGNYLTGFEPSFKDLFFVGLNEERKLIGGKFDKQADLDRLKPVFGVSFVPILLQNGKSQTIPEKWLTTPQRAARTVIANYKHDHLLFLVTNARDESGKSGATLPELQSLLKRLGAVDAYNLDGGGSTTLVVNNTVLNQPSDGRLRPLATHFLFFE
ncbi:phosphodiester glycosidase family protein [Xylanibacillus composti]|uniref:Phosphodiester glycosidase domain-containing protein n=1 Tax=Xylanibacillus composti TaxID=1572762 RepID=A0A8J4H8N3_9BACL|nr:phosphodiester glycosidase family protein [Xylanibacillus composti]MDT9724727.1 phosphodiester glycosidase family protein [Xylanibacillus composti]GIQ70728.1 hypothetical protein XYCOK13_35520 [Xylanibacillus composti]